MSVVNQSSQTLAAVPRTASFVEHLASPPGATGRAMNVWAPVVTGDWSTDCAQGRAYAQEAIEFMRKTGNPSCLGHIVKGMIGNGAYTGVEVGFLQRFGEEAIASAGF